jgi:cell division protein FtsB
MRFLEVIKRKKILFLNIFLLLYILINLLDGNRGLLSYFEKKEVQKELNEKQIFLTQELEKTEYKNKLLSDNLNFDFVDILIRDKLKFGHKEEILIKLND